MRWRDRWLPRAHGITSRDYLVKSQENKSSGLKQKVVETWVITPESSSDPRNKGENLHAYTCTHICMYTHPYTHMHTLPCTPYTHTHRCSDTHIHIHSHTKMHTHILTYTHMRLHIHTPTTRNKTNAFRDFPYRWFNGLNRHRKKEHEPGLP